MMLLKRLRLISGLSTRRHELACQLLTMKASTSCENELAECLIGMI